MLREGENFGSFKGDAGELRNGVEQDRDGRRIGDRAIVANVGFRAVDGLVVVRGFDERDGIAEQGSAFGAGDGFGRGFGAGARD